MSNDPTNAFPFFGNSAELSENSLENADSVDVETLAERFVDEYRRGKTPSVDEYAARTPELADEIRDLFPALLLLEKGGTREALSDFSQSVGRQGVVLDGFDRLKNYRLIREIGRGGMGVVYEAWDETLERVVAVKVMKIFPGEEEQTIKRFQREVKMAAKLHHTNIVPVYGSDVVDDKFFYVMQLIDGVSLEQFLRLKEDEASQTLRSSSKKLPQIGEFLSKISKSSRSSKGAKGERVPNGSDCAKTLIWDAGLNAVKTARASKNFATTLGAAEKEELALDETAALSPEFDPERKNATSSPANDVLSQNSPQKSTSEATKNSAKDSALSVSKRDEKASKKRLRRGLPAPDEPLLSVRVSDSNYYRRVCDLGIQAAQGLDYAHRHNVVHRDVKPSNLVVDDDGVLWIADFGLAKPTNETELTRNGQLVGTLRYLSPEALEGNFSPLSDVYSLGLTLYELLTFSPAFDERTYSKLLAQVATGSLTRPRKINPRIPRDLETIVLKATEKNTEKRYASAGALAEDLRRFLDELPIQARRVGIFGRAWRWCKRNKIIAALLCFIGLLLSTIFAVVTTGYFHTRTLLAEKNVESLRAQTESSRAQMNLELALSAFDDVFATLGEGPEVNLDLLSETASFASPTDNPSITEKDARVLDSLLVFYDGFARANEKETSLLLKSARAYAKMGGIRRLLGRSQDNDTYQIALDFYRRALDSASPEERSTLVLEKAAVLYAAFTDGGGKGKNTAAEFAPVCSEALAELNEISDDSPLAESRRRWAARLRFVRAVLNVECIRRGTGDPFGLFDVLSYERPSDELIGVVQSDFNAVRERLDALRESGVPQTPEYLLYVCKFYAYYSVWKSTLGQSEEARNLQEQGIAFARIFATLYPNDSRSYVATIIQFVVKSIVDGELDGEEAIGVATENGVSRLDRSESPALEAVNGLVAKFPNSPQYAIFQIVVHFHFAKREALARNLDRADYLLEKANEQMNAFCALRPNFDRFQFFAPLSAGRVELFLAQKRFDDAEAQLQALDSERQKYRARFNKDAPENERAEFEECWKKDDDKFERLRRKIDEERAAEALPTPTAASDSTPKVSGADPTVDSSSEGSTTDR